MNFKYKAKNLKGEEISGVLEAEDKFALARELTKKGFILVDYEKEGKKNRFDFSIIKKINIGGIPLHEKIIFTRNLAVMMGAGLALSRAIAVLIEQAKNQQFKNVLLKVAENVAKGKSLSESLAEHKKIFSPLYVSMIKAGEKSGRLHECLKILADEMEASYSLKRKVQGAMVYPAIVVLAMIGIAILMLIYVVPSLVSTFKDLNVELPASTRFIIWLSNSLVTNSLMLLAGLALVFFAFYFFWKKPAFKKVKDKLLLSLPLLSPLIIQINTARTARTLSSLIDSGVEIIESVEITADVLQNEVYKNVLVAAKDKIQKGDSISSSFKEVNKIYPPLLAEMIAVGEETGKLGDMLSQLADFYEEEVAQATKNIATIIEPVLMIFIGAAVGFFAISMIKPMYSMLGGI